MGADARAEAALGMTDYIDWRKTVEDMADSLLELEANWYPEGKGAPVPTNATAAPQQTKITKAKGRDWVWLLLPPAVGFASYVFSHKEYVPMHWLTVTSRALTA